MKTIILFLLLLAPAAGLFAQDDATVTALILHKDSLFWQDYNTCNVTDIRQFFSDDIEFYHDKGGVTIGLDTFMTAIRHGLCRDPAHYLLRREAVKGTVQVYPLHKDGVVYGAVISGQHVFYVNESGKSEYLDGLARFTHLWLLKNGEWKMARVLSYDHGPAPYVNNRHEISLPADVLQTYKGHYAGPQNTVDISVENGQLLLVIHDSRMVLWAESKDHFFSKERDLTFTFLPDGKLVVREHGAVTEELGRQ
ncbi:nuclear transport factor 2 family protein [Dinghuibacter silviterrae]|uniref:Uncharacterized protein DUF4440 n=1 Tax=Dinghuibacter silviterrae TaxID=1539049 RepID=A0A4R8DGU6_9BACT|nr:nuclear transport factor 2 family protein [Dinghuibacter silviterrae]TDW96735.1 uncharacterized protein DUF4440 [Dinghuibacter silviterrae]